MSADPIQRLLEARIGLDPDSLGASALAAAVADRVRAVGAASPTTYAERLTADPAEFQALVDRLVVPETWFFRGRGLFEFLATRIAERVRATPGRTVRALSVPCSTGEEPYSLAIALTDAGVSPDRVAIDAADISPPNLLAARRGVYRDFSFRHTPPEFRERWFRPTDGGWELAAAVRDRVRFFPGNLIDPTLLADATGAYDVVLCRNLLIYLTPDGRKRAIAALDRLLAPGGWLVVGHAEPGAVAGKGFHQVGPDGLFVFARGDSAKTPPAVPTSPRSFPPSPFPGGGRGEGANRPHPGRPDPTPGRSPKRGGEPEPPAPEPPLSRARQLADSGQLADALVAAEAIVAATPTADGFALLGVVREARGETSAAADAFRKALYLDPDHREALAHAALLARAAGNHAQADVYRARLARLAAGGAP